MLLSLCSTKLPITSGNIYRESYSGTVAITAHIFLRLLLLDFLPEVFFSMIEQVAHRMKDEEGFFYPHNVDFRGRAYPMHPHLNHLGSDICRGVLEFAAGRPLGKSGLRWLKIHLANLFAGGVDKLSLDGRIAFTESHLDDIFDSADKPLEGRCWWLNAEDPFQCLAVCINLSEAVRSSSPETVISHVPVHQASFTIIEACTFNLSVEVLERKKP